MEINYTTVTGYDVAQPNPEKSLGGFKSRTQVPNGDFGNIFDEISVMSIKNGKDEYRAIIFLNNEPETLTNFKISMDIGESVICSYKMAASVLKNKNKSNQYYMDSVQSQYSKPYIHKFVDMTAGAEVLVGDVPPNSEVGIWVSRHVDIEKATVQYETVCEPDENDPTARRYKAVKPEKVEQVDMLFSWE